jgi:hypothetical protein
MYRIKTKLQLQLSKQMLEGKSSPFFFENNASAVTMLLQM